MIVRFSLCFMEEEVFLLIFFFLPKKDSFWFLAGLLESLGLKETYMNNFPGLKEAFYVHLSLIKEYFPKVFNYFVFLHMLFFEGYIGNKALDVLFKLVYDSLFWFLAC